MLAIIVVFVLVGCCGHGRDDDSLPASFANATAESFRRAMTALVRHSRNGWTDQGGHRHDDDDGDQKCWFRRHAHVN